MSSTLAGSYGRYTPVASHPLVRIDVYCHSHACHSHADYVTIWYVGDREPILALGFIPEERLTFPRPKVRGKGSKPRRNSGSRRVRVDAYWRTENGAAVRRFRVLIDTTLADALELPGVREVLLAQQRERSEQEKQEARERHAIVMGEPAPTRRVRPALHLVVDNTREVQP